MNLLTVVASFKARPGLEEKAREALLALVEPTRKEPGCVQYDLHLSTDKPGEFLFFEKWVDRESLDQHLNMPYIHTLRGRVEELFLEPPDIRIYSRLI